MLNVRGSKFIGIPKLHLSVKVVKMAVKNYLMLTQSMTTDIKVDVFTYCKLRL